MYIVYGHCSMYVYSIKVKLHLIHAYHGSCFIYFMVHVLFISVHTNFEIMDSTYLYLINM
ncbi:hypothetical protein Hanom_Chr12g01075821 [Helianthus anomalus]